jgi:polynucleotide 5'-kinase involved in rRNA processing
LEEPLEFYASLRERVMGERGVVMVIGGADTGKTTMSRYLLEGALDAGLRAAFIDADVGVSTVGPPACVGLRWVRTHDDLVRLGDADELRFVGSTHPQGVVLPHVVSTAALVDVARQEADFIVLDTTSVVAGVLGQTLKYHLMEVCAPTLVIVMQRGEEMEPIIGMLRRFLSARIAKAAPPPDLVPASPVDRRARRIESFRRALEPPLPRWRVHTSVFAPTLPEGFDVSRLAAMLVGVQDGEGRCLGLGALEYDQGVVRVATHFGEQMKGLRLGSLQINLDTYETTRIRLSELIFGF